MNETEVTAKKMIDDVIKPQDEVAEKIIKY
jgi:hypothetical protein